MFAMLNFRLVAAIAALQIFVVTVLWPQPHPLFGLLLGAAAAAALLAVGRAVLRQRGVAPGTAPAGRADRFLYLAAASALLAQYALFRVLQGPAAGPWVNVATLLVAIALLVFASVGLNRVAPSRQAGGEG